jgi:hypothetical protein
MAAEGTFLPRLKYPQEHAGRLGRFFFILGDSSILRDLKRIAPLVDTVSVKFGLKLSVGPELSPCREYTLEYRITVDDLAGVPSWIHQEREMLITEPSRMARMAPWRAVADRPRASGLKYDLLCHGSEMAHQSEGDAEK